jgi:hypothetical protein
VQLDEAHVISSNCIPVLAMIRFWKNWQEGGFSLLPNTAPRRTEHGPRSIGLKIVGDLGVLGAPLSPFFFQ